jgi:hypothetical protein
MSEAEVVRFVERKRREHALRMASPPVTCLALRQAIRLSLLQTAPGRPQARQRSRTITKKGLTSSLNPAGHPR